MASPSFGYSTWRRKRASSPTSSHDNSTQDDLLAGQIVSPPRSSHPQVVPDSKVLSSSFSSTGHREPIRSYVHGTLRDNLSPLDGALSARSVREDTAELASYVLSDRTQRPSPSFLKRARSHSSQIGGRTSSDSEFGDTDDLDGDGRPSDTIVEVSEPPSPENHLSMSPAEPEGPSVLASMLRRSPPGATMHDDVEAAGRLSHDKSSVTEEEEEQQQEEAVVQSPRHQPESSAQSSFGHPSETTPLLRESPQHDHHYANGSQGGSTDLESQKAFSRKFRSGVAQSVKRAGDHARIAWQTASDPKRWDRKAVWNNVVVAPVVCLPAVVVGLLLNILDALSYGMILFPLGSPIFANLGSSGISIFYVSTIISQLTFSFGSIFKGGVGSELIEVVPFFHSMAATITDAVGEDDPEAVIATTITSYALSSMLTGTVFYLMGAFKFGYVVGFIPRHILIGCIGGVGWFLVATGFEVTARINGSLEYDLDTLRKLAKPDTIPLWIIPLVLAVVLFYAQTRVSSKYFLPLYIIAIPCIFYFFVFSLDALNPDTLRDHGWIFQGPPAGEPWWYFYTLYQFDKVHWDAILQTVPAMFALTFFGILHVPINVPALALNTGEDHADLNHELKLHGYSNLFSGLAGSIQNYLVYANTLFFMRSGGDSRLAGIELAVLTFFVMTIGPVLIGYIPVMMVGVLIFDLGFELLIEAVWLPRKKLKSLEYLTVVAIVLIMGIYDFVVGIGVGILLAFVSLIFQASQVSAVRASYSGAIVGSTVRRNPSQHHYLQQVGKQIYIIKLAGYLFFGTIVSVEDKIRALISDEAFQQRPIKFLILDLWQVTGLDYSAGEAFNTISRLLDGKGIVFVLSGLDPESSLGQDLRAVGVGEDGIEVRMLPDLNSALESCENELLKTLYASEDAVRASRTAPMSSLDVPGSQQQLQQQLQQQRSQDLMGSSPRRVHLHEAAKKSLENVDGPRSSRWQSFKEPLRLMLQIFQELSGGRNEDFWFRAVGYFARLELAAGTVVFRRGERADGFYLVESGILRADYDLPQGWYCESIVAGTTCGELPFFSETSRTATAAVERDAVVWRMDRDAWARLQREEPDVAQELLRISLKLTSERMSVITSYILTMAG